jgi:hypothetical protein
MATDKSEPRVGLILKAGVLAIATLLVVHAALVAYFDHIAQAEEHRKFGDTKPEALWSVREAESASLTSGPMPIDKAMQQIAARGRMAASPDIMPSVSKDTAPLQGWVKMPAHVPVEMTAPPAATGLPNDAGVTMDGTSLALPGRALPADGAVPKATDLGAAPGPPVRRP